MTDPRRALGRRPRRSRRSGPRGPAVGGARARPAPRARPTVGQRPTAGYVVAHELRTPLTTLILGSRILLDNPVGAGLRRDVLHDVAAEAQRLSDAVEDLLVLAGLEATAHEVEPVSIQAAVRAELDRASRVARRLRVRALLPADVAPVVTDAGVLRHLVHDLVTASVEAAGERGVLEVILARMPADGARLCISARPAPAAGDAVARPAAPLRRAAVRTLADRIGACLLLEEHAGRTRAELSLRGTLAASDERSTGRERSAPVGRDQSTGGERTTGGERSTGGEPPTMPRAPADGHVPPPATQV